MIYRGVTGLKTRIVNQQRVLIIPIIFLLWPIIAIYSELEKSFVGLLSFCVGLVIGGSIGLQLWKGNGICHPETKTFERKGSSLTLLLIIFAFSTKYILSVNLHLHPDYSSSSQFSILFGGLSGMWDGLFWGGVILLFSQMRKYNQ